MNTKKYVWRKGGKKVHQAVNSTLCGRVVVRDRRWLRGDYFPARLGLCVFCFGYTNADEMKRIEADARTEL